MINPIKITLTTAGASTESFSLFSDADGYVTPFATGITKAQLLAGYVSSVAPDLTSVVRVKSNTACMNSTDLILIRKITLSTTSTSATWSPSTVTNTGATLTWDVTGDITPTSQNLDTPSFDLSLNSGTVNMVAYDVSGLTIFYCYSNNLTLLDVSQNIALEQLECGINQLTTLNVSNNIALTDLYCSANQLTSLNVSSNINLRFLACQDNQLPSLDLSHINIIEYLDCFGNNMSPTATDQIYIDLANGTTYEGFLRIRNNRTAASDTARATLVSRGWTINESYPT